MRLRCWVLGPAAGVAACGGTPPPAPAPTAPTTSAPEAPARDAGVIEDAGGDGPDATPAAGPRVRFEPVDATPAPDPLPHVEIKFPVMEKPIRLPKAARYKVRLDVTGWPLGKRGAGLQLSLDDHPPRVFTTLAEPIRLGQLVSEDQHLEPGPHFLFAVAVRAGGETVKAPRPTSRAPFAAVRFHVGTRGEPAVDAPRLVYSQPRGTYNGVAAADSVLVDFYVLGVELEEQAYGVEVTVRGRDDTWSARVRRWQPLRIRGLPSGDYQVTLQLIDAGDQALPGSAARASRVITVNRDAAAPDELAP